MKVFNIRKAIYKYAILLSIQYLINLIWIYLLFNIFNEYTIEYKNSYPIDYISLIPRAITVIFNIIYAILVLLDLKFNEIKSPLIILITLFFGFIGIALYFILLIYNLYIKKTSTQHKNKPH